MSPKINQALQLFVSTTVVLTQTGISTYANNTDINQFEQHSPLYTDNLDTSSEALITEDIIPYAAAVNPKKVYTQLTKSNLDRSGDSSITHPYNRFEDALANVEDGGEIIIKSGGSAFINGDEYGQIPRTAYCYALSICSNISYYFNSSAY